MAESKCFLEGYVIEKYVNELQCFPIEDILSPRWIVQSCRLIQLSLQMMLEASQNRHQYVQYQLTLHHKSMILVWELVTSEAWRQKLLPHLLANTDNKPVTSLPIQLVLQSESAAAGILGVLLCDDDSTSSIDSLVLDVIDWSVRQLTEIVSLALKEEEELLHTPKEEFATKDFTDEKNELQDDAIVCNEIKRDLRKSLLSFGIRGVELLQQVSLHRKVLPLCATTRLLRVHDVPQLIATLLQVKPWQKSYNGHVYYFEDGQWTKTMQSGLKMSKVEAQQWLLLFSLLLKHDDLGTYEVTSGRKGALLKLQEQLNNFAVKEIPALEPLARWISSLSFATPQAPKNPPLVTTVPQIGDTPFSNWDGKFEELSLLHIERTFNPTQDFLNGLARRFAAAYDLEVLEFLLPQTPVCALCGEHAGRRCSRCRTQWYCRRSCQVSHWEKHQQLCDLVAKNSKKENDTKMIDEMQ